MAQYRYNDSLESVLQPLADQLEQRLIKNGYEHDEVKGFGVDILSGVVAEMIHQRGEGNLLAAGLRAADELDITQYEN